VNWLWRLDKPEYFYRPAQVLKRLAWSQNRAPTDVELPWGLPITVHPGDSIGWILCTQGVYDLALTEVIWRLLDAGDMAVDAGANIGYVTGLMAVRAGPRGSVAALEPHPDIFAELQHNVIRWRTRNHLAAIALHNLAASESRNKATLYLPRDFSHNRGVSTLGADQNSVAGPTVETVPLDELIPGPVTLLKIDVEGHELTLLKGCQRLLSRRGIRDIVFEEHQPYPSAVHQLLEDAGYRVVRIDRAFRGPLLLDSAQPCRHPFLPSNYLATLDLERCVSRMEQRGWFCLKSAN
jgi:FkbM family methyltransferase